MDFMDMCDRIHGEGSDLSAKAQQQYSAYNEGIGIFGREVVMKAAKGMRASAWWAQ